RAPRTVRGARCQSTKPGPCVRDARSAPELDQALVNTKSDQAEPRRRTDRDDTGSDQQRKSGDVPGRKAFASTLATHPGKESDMWPDRRLLDLFGIEVPIVQAPMAGFVSTDMVIAVT